MEQTGVVSCGRGKKKEPQVRIPTRRLPGVALAETSKAPPDRMRYSYTGQLC
jgi:hypothetical protein